MIAGGGADAFWHQTPRLIASAIAAYVRAREADWRAGKAMAWANAALGRAGEMPDFDDWMDDAGSDNGSEAAQQAVYSHNLRAWAMVIEQRFGGEC